MYVIALGVVRGGVDRGASKVGEVRRRCGVYGVRDEVWVKAHGMHACTLHRMLDFGLDVRWMRYGVRERKEEQVHAIVGPAGFGPL